MTAPPDGPVTLPVTHLSLASHFYLSSLRPLGYQIVSRVRHQTADGSSEAVGIGPENTRRVDVFLSQSPRSAKEAHGGKTAYVVFPATSGHAVRDFYAAALDAGGRPVSAPDDKPGPDNTFAATVADIDGNKVQVTFKSDSTNMPNPPYRNTQVLHVDRGAAVELRPSRGATRTFYPVSPAQARAGSSGRYNDPGTVEVRPMSKTENGTGNMGANAMVGTLMGAAAGAALTYAMVKEQGDSRAREAEFNTRMDARARVKEEARAHCEASDRAARSRGVPTRRSSFHERDSGYNSGSSPRGGDSAKDYTTARPQPGASRVRRSSSQREPRRTEYTPAPLKHSSTMPIRGSNQSQRATPPSLPRSANTVNTPSMPPGPPSPLFGTRTRARVGQDSPPASRHSSSTIKAPQSYTRRTAASKTPSKSSKGAPSTNHTARQAPLPSSKATSYSSARDMRLPPSHASAPAVDDEEDNVLDDLETLVPDDSISCAPSPPPPSSPQRSRRSQYKPPSRTLRTAKTSSRGRTSRPARQIAVV